MLFTGGLWEQRIKQWILSGLVLHILTPVFVSTVWGGSNPETGVAAQFWMGFGLTSLLWGVGYVMTHLVTETANAELVAFTPLTPRRYYLENARRVRALLITFYALVPFLSFFIFGLALIVDESFPCEPWPLAAALLCYCLSFGAPFTHEATGASALSWPFFLLRWPVRFALRHLRWTLFFLVTGIILGKWLGPIFEAGIVLVERGVLALHGFGVVGDFAIFLLSPFSGILIASQPEQPWVLPLVYLGASLAVAFSCVARVRTSFREIEEFYDEMKFDSWTDARPEVEATEREEDAAESEAMDAWSERFSTLEADEEDCARRGLAYLPHLPHAVQLFRHHEFYLGPERPVSQLRRFWQFALGDSYRFAIFVIGLLYLGHFNRSEGYTPIFILAGFCVMNIHRHASALRPAIVHCVSAPQRWGRLLWLSGRTLFVRYTPADLLAAWLFARVLDAGLAGMLYAWLALAAFRVQCLLFPRLQDLANGWRRWPYHAQNVAQLSAAFLSILVPVILLAFGEGTKGADYLFTGGGALLSLACVGLGLLVSCVLNIAVAAGGTGGCITGYALWTWTAEDAGKSRTEAEEG